MDRLAIDVIEQAEKSSELVIDVESSHQKIHLPSWKIRGLGIGSKPHYYYTEDFGAMRDLASLVWSGPFLVIGHHINWDLHALRKAFGLAYYPERIACTMVAENLIDDNLPDHQLGLKKIILRRFKHAMRTFEQATNPGLFDTGSFTEYNIEDLKWTNELWLKQKDELANDNLTRLFDRILMPFLKCVADFEMFGIGISIPDIRELVSLFKGLSEDTLKKIEDVLGTIDLNSGDALAKRLFGELKYSTEGLSETKSGARISVGEDSLNKLALKYPVCKDIMTYRNATKMISTYLEPVAKMALEDPHTRIHPTMWVTSALGRTRQSDPSAQTTPKLERGKDKKYDIRRSYVARPGHKLIIADVSQFHLRIGVRLTGDEGLTRCFTTWVCKTCNSTGTSTKLLLTCPKCGALPDERVIHSERRRSENPEKYVGWDGKGFWHGLDLHQETYESIKLLKSRDAGKTTNFALLYNANKYKMHYEYPEYSIEQWDTIIREYFKDHRGMKRFHEQIESELRKGATTLKCLFGRKRRITKAMIDKHFRHSLNQAINCRFLMTEVNYMLLATAKIREAFIQAGCWNDGRVENYGACLFNFMHDEVVLECPDDFVERGKEIVRNTLRYCVDLGVPIEAEVKVQQHWGKV